MEQRGLKGALALGLLATACASGDGVPTATIENGFTDTCIVEASFLEYSFTDPIGPTGRMSAREVVEGSGVAYAVVMKPGTGEECVDLARKQGGALWISKQKFSTKAGELTRIAFSLDTATEVTADCNSVEYFAGLKLFSRLPNPCATDAGP